MLKNTFKIFAKAAEFHQIWSNFMFVILDLEANFRLFLLARPSQDVFVLPHIP